MPKLDLSKAKGTIRIALKEDIGSGDVTSRSVVSGTAKAKGKIVAKASGIVAGLGVAKLVFEAANKKVKVNARVQDGAKVYTGKVIAEVSGPARSILSAERTALNFLQRMSGIATLTGEFVERVKGQGSRVKILGTRKTAPGLRILDKYSIEVGGGLPHRMGLYDAILIKENHIEIAGGIKRAVALAKKSAPRGMRVELEARNIKEVRGAIEAGADTILLDNMSVAAIRDSVKLIKRFSNKIQTEASGGVTLNNVAAIARTGVDFVSIGALTHSPKALDISLELS